MITATLPEDAIATIAGYFTGNRRDLFLESIAVLRESLAQGAWVKRGAQRADKGINRGIASHKGNFSDIYAYNHPKREAAFAVYMASLYGQRRLTQEQAAAMSDDDLRHIAPKVPTEVMRAWLRLVIALRPVWRELDASRPLPVYTEIGLSPKVTKTLQGVGLDLDLSTRRVAPIGERWAHARDHKTFKPLFESDGTPKMVKVYFVQWPKGTLHDTSRFAHADCQACGKSIPSGALVPVLVNDRAGATHGFWFGCDCARNIFGIKDVGISRTAAESEQA